MHDTPITPTTPAKTLHIALPPIINIIPPSLPSPPLTPSSPTPASARAIPAIPSPYNVDDSTHHSLHHPLRRHLALLHPATPAPILSFVVSRLLSRDKPYGHSGSWTPLWAMDGCFDLSTAGLGVETRGCKQKEGGRGREVDRKVEEMYTVARKSWGLLEEEKAGENRKI